MKKFLLITLLAIVALPATAGRYRLPMYVTNSYFCNELKNDDGNIQPDRIFNVMKAGEKELRGAFVLNIIADEGLHKVEVDLLDSNTRKFDTITLQPVEADEDNYVYTAVALFGGEMPEGGVFFKVYDTADNGKRKPIYTTRIMTIK